MSALDLNFDISKINSYRGLPYWAAALLCGLCSTLGWPLFLCVPGLAFWGLGVATWSALRQRDFERTGRPASRERLLQIAHQRAQNCDLARNLQIYRRIAPFFWSGYSVFLLLTLLG